MRECFHEFLKKFVKLFSARLLDFFFMDLINSLVKFTRAIPLAVITCNESNFLDSICIFCRSPSITINECPSVEVKGGSCVRVHSSVQHCLLYLIAKLDHFLFYKILKISLTYFVKNFSLYMMRKLVKNCHNNCKYVVNFIFYQKKISVVMFFTRKIPLALVNFL